MDYVTAVIALAATILGVCGETRNGKGRGIRALTRVGYAALALAILACSITIIQIRHAHQEKEERRAEAALQIGFAVEQIISSIYWSRTNQSLSGLDKSRPELIQKLQILGSRIGRLLDLYGDTLPNNAQSAVIALHLATTESAQKAGNKHDAKEYLEYLDGLIDKLANTQSLNTSFYRSRPLSEFAFDFDHPEPDPSWSW